MDKPRQKAERPPALGWVQTPGLVALGLLGVAFGLASANVIGVLLSFFSPDVLTVTAFGINTVSLLFLGTSVATMFVFNDVLFRPELWRTVFFCFCLGAVAVLVCIAQRRSGSGYLDQFFFGVQFSFWLQISATLFNKLSAPLVHKTRRSKSSYHTSRMDPTSRRRLTVSSKE